MRRALSVLLCACLFWANSPLPALAGLTSHAGNGVPSGFNGAAGAAVSQAAAALNQELGLGPSGLLPVSVTISDLILGAPAHSLVSAAPALAPVAAARPELPAAEAVAPKLEALFARAALLPTTALPAAAPSRVGAGHAEEQAAGEARGRDVRALVAAVDEVLAEVSAGDLRRMPVEQLDDYARRLLDRMQGTRSIAASEAADAEASRAPGALRLKPAAPEEAEPEAAPKLPPPAPAQPWSRTKAALRVWYLSTLSVIMLSMIAPAVHALTGGHPMMLEHPPMERWAYTQPLVFEVVDHFLSVVGPAAGLAYLLSRLVPGFRWRDARHALAMVAGVAVLGVPILLNMPLLYALMPLWGFVFWNTLLHAAGEEVIDRGLLFESLQKGLKRVGTSPAPALIGAAFFSSLFFAATHIPNWGYHPVTFLYHTLMGLMFVAIYRRTGSLLVPVIAHAWFNLSRGDPLSHTVLLVSTSIVTLYVGIWLLWKLLQSLVRLAGWPLRARARARARRLRALSAQEQLWTVEIDKRLRWSGPPEGAREVERLLHDLRAAAEPVLAPAAAVYGTSLDRALDVYDHGELDEEDEPSDAASALDAARRHAMEDRSPPVLLRARGPAPRLADVDIFLPAQRVWVPLEVWADVFHEP